MSKTSILPMLIGLLTMGDWATTFDSHAFDGTAFDGQASEGEQRLLIGTNAEENGIFASTLNLASGDFGPAEAVGDAPRPGFLALHPQLPLLYAVTSEKARPAGGLRAFRLEATTPQATARTRLPTTRKLDLISRQATGDEGATHLAVAPSGAAIVVAHYSGGSTALLPLSRAGSIEPVSTLVHHDGASVHPDRQTKSHAHGVAFDNSGQFACVADLGTDEVIVYRLLEGAKLERQASWDAAPGAGPRHLAFHPGGRWLYCINELNSTLSVLGFDAKTGKLTELETVSTLPSDFEGLNTTAEVVVHPSGEFVYSSNRGHDSTAAFSIDTDTGRLTLIEIEPTQGGHPRFIGMEPSGNYLIAANRDANNLVSFRIDRGTGALAPTGHQVQVPQPVCVVFPRAPL